jgi:transcriptional regulator with XRE-family HTH domain
MMTMTETAPLTDVFSLASPGTGDSLGARIRLLRRRRGLTQEGLAAAVGVSRSAVALWETNRGGEAQNLSAIATALKVPIEYFINGMARQDVQMVLSFEEASLVQLYRQCAAPERLTLLRTAGRLTSQSRRTARDDG